MVIFFVFRGVYALELVAHGTLLCLLQLWGKIVDILDGKKGPCEVVAHTDDIDTSVVCGETRVAVEIVDLWLNTGEIVDIVDGFHWDCLLVGKSLNGV